MTPQEEAEYRRRFTPGTDSIWRLPAPPGALARCICADNPNPFGPCPIHNPDVVTLPEQQQP